MQRLIILLLSFLLFLHQPISAGNTNANRQKILLGIDQLFTAPYLSILKDKKIGLITNHTGIDSKMRSTIDLLKENAQTHHYSLVALFAPEHGLRGSDYAYENVKHEVDPDGIPVYSLHGETRRPTAEMLKDITLLIYDIQDIGTRSYTFASTLFYVMEEASKKGIPVLVLDRPNPINGLIVDGPMLEDKFRSFVGYINTPYCHGMTIGELSLFFNEEYHVNCDLHIVPMKGWRREMSFSDTGLAWIPTSPHIPEADTPLYYPTTGLLGEIPLVSIGVGYTLPFKIIGAPWIDANIFAKELNDRHVAGATFYPFYYKPFFGRHSKENCQGVLIVVTDPTKYKPVSTQFLILGVLKALYPEKFEQSIASLQNNKAMFNTLNGTEEILNILKNEKYIVWKLRDLHQKERSAFLEKRNKYLISSYAQK